MQHSWSLLGHSGQSPILAGGGYDANDPSRTSWLDRHVRHQSVSFAAWCGLCRGKAMELPGTGFLYTIATLSITYAGFAALIVIFRQIIGGEVSNYDVFFVRAVLLRSFIVTCSALLPPALALFDLSHPVVWRISSVVAALLQGLFILTRRTRRRAVTDFPTPIRAQITLGLGAFTVIALLMNAFGVFGKPDAGPFVISVTAFLIISFYVYLSQLENMLRGPTKK